MKHLQKRPQADGLTNLVQPVIKACATSLGTSGCDRKGRANRLFNVAATRSFSDESWCFIASCEQTASQLRRFNEVSLKPISTSDAFAPLQRNALARLLLIACLFREDPKDTVLSLLGPMRACAFRGKRPCLRRPLEI